jgi:phage repressor protein C with HTH and peptisase S24 domain
MQVNLDKCNCVEVTSDRHLPTYKKGDVLVLLPGVKVEGYDHVAVRLKDGTDRLAMLAQKNRRGVILLAFGGKHKLETIKMKDIANISRVATSIHA